MSHLIVSDLNFRIDVADINITKALYIIVITVQLNNVVTYHVYGNWQVIAVI